MADKKATLVIDLQDQVTGKLNALKNQILAFGASFISFEAIKKIVTDTDEWASSMTKASQQTGMSVKTLQELKFVVESTHSSFEGLVTGLEFFNRALGAANAGGVAQKEMFADLGVATVDATGHARNATDAFFDFRDKLSKVTDEGKFSIDMMLALGRGGRDLAPLFRMSSEEVAHLMKTADDLGVVLNQKTIVEIMKFDAASQGLNSAMKAVELEIGAALMPVLTKLATMLVAMKLYIDDNSKSIVDFGFKFASVLVNPMSLIPVLIQLLKDHSDASQKAGMTMEQAFAKATEMLKSFQTEIKKTGNEEQTLTQKIQAEYRKRIQAAQDSYERNASFSMQLRTTYEKDWTSMSTVAVGTIHNMTDSFASGIGTMIKTHQSFHDVFKNFWDDMLAYFVEQIIKQMVAQWVSAMLTMSIASAAVGAPGGGGAGGMGGAAASGAAQGFMSRFIGMGMGGGGAAAAGGGFIGPPTAAQAYGSQAMAAFGPIMGAAAITAYSGMLSAQYLGHDTKAGNIGTIVGSVFGGPIGGAIGAAIGGLFGGDDGPQNIGGGSLPELRDRRAREKAGQNVQSEIRGTGFQAQAFYNAAMDMGYEPTEEQIQRNLWRFDGTDFGAQVALIQGIIRDHGGAALARGGMVLPRNGGTLAMIGEAGKSEAVIPLDDPQTKSKLKGVMGGDTIVINAGTIVADPVSFNKLVEMIDTALYKRRKNGQSLSA